MAPGCRDAVIATPEVEQARIDERIRGVWRLNSYVPDHALSPALLLSMSADAILVRFEDGRMRSATSALDFDRTYRIANVDGLRFSVFISDPHGFEVESRCTLGSGGEIAFQTITEPWKGHGVLIREGAALGM